MQKGDFFCRKMFFLHKKYKKIKKNCKNLLNYAENEYILKEIYKKYGNYLQEEKNGLRFFELHHP